MKEIFDVPRIKRDAKIVLVILMALAIVWAAMSTSNKQITLTNTPTAISTPR